MLNATLLRDPSPTMETTEAAVSAAIADLGAGQADRAISRLSGFAPAPQLGAGLQSLIGRVLVNAGAYRRALPWFDAALADDPRQMDGLAGRAEAHLGLDETEAAIAAFEAAFATGLRDASAYFDYGMLMLRIDNKPMALTALDRALTLRPAYPAALRAAGRLLDGDNNPEGALHLFRLAIQHGPQDLDAVLDCAALLRRQERLLEAMAIYDDAVPRLSRDALLWNNRGILLHDLGRMDEALVSLDGALALDATLAQAHLNRGMVLVRLERQLEAIQAFGRALALQPAYPEAFSSRGLALKMLGRFDAARADFDAALAIDPGFIYALANRGELDLLLGDLPKGWAEYEYRFFTERQEKPALKRPTPEWRGPTHAVRRLAVFADQGSGDSLQFSRFLPAVAALVPEVTLICLPRLHRALRDVTLGLTVVDAVAEDASFDAQITLSSLPTVFGVDAAQLARSKPYLSAEAALVNHWAARIGTDGFRVGLCWRGSQNWQCDPGRSVPFVALAPLASVPGVRFFSLQMPDNAERAGEARGLVVEDLSGELDRGADAFIDTAAVMANLDLVITCDTSIVHLAGALGCPVWVLLQKVPEWRWLLERSDSPWYPGARLFRQTRRGEWDAPVAALTAALCAAVAA
ncbi:tetratricopeptide repeat-containing glycosyltransferase family protein [Lichenihabitans sp. Uapishka_5]|uniref:tetratricopeptide repeat-containing glycosyltransferase family protein n=1 Tax=Lichenihabitans sp. Uapishka_5 TaxID=3037302 RepID=UPI0029E82263|nr:tetratricopeptide repeat-containing glycosyltransferase family protein [Lichenihabitans sp. Uapishka_5]MDX7950952.1 tetratricopeptide repeat-containing glycosyltransferase family protein [Lichenihabitans sp. Uapishka_5]